VLVAQLLHKFNALGVPSSGDWPWGFVSVEQAVVKPSA
jgi:hypothetical protein